MVETAASHAGRASTPTPGLLAALICTLLLTPTGCALKPPPESGSGTASAAESPPPAPVVVRLDPRRLGGEVRDRTRELAGREDLRLARSEAGYYADVQEAQLVRALQGTNIGLFRTSDSIMLRIPGADAFDTGSSELKPGALPPLTAISGVLSEYGKTFVVVISHTDGTGDPEYNQRLSEQRAFTIASFLIEHDVRADRIAVVGHGETRPLDGADAQGVEWTDRRIEIRLELIVEPASP